ncbi:Tyrosyl-DNA phosphodiesterase 2 [Desmophyllum pertusum]|uniref:Tyrosyl-DNA phosphodiesterase 2 n=1 Tax=Desmophyllum pertusum TaxID=174260 RepID=A0A9X0D0C4_9CNID|nr:Tyrosyl-DNA phosphodiesterase 2 [Desmophyllum pertusum]
MVVTGVEDTVAMCYLQQSSWNVESAINTFFESPIDGGGQGNRDNPIMVSDHGLLDSSDGSLNSQLEAEKSNPNLTVLSWNIDGLDERNLLERTRKVCHVINSEKPDAVFLQEVIPETLSIFQSKCPGYVCKYHEPTCAYFNLMLLKNSSIKTTHDLQCTHFHSSKMERHLLCQPVMFKNKTELILMTSHLESTGEGQCKVERKGQLQQVLTSMTEQPPQATVIFGGDTNLRDAEVSAIGGLPNGIVDAWEESGSPADAKFTWDVSINDNLDLKYRNKPRLRFDRLFVRSAQPRML